MIKRLLLATFLLLLFSQNGFGQSDYTENWQIDLFYSDIIINKDRSIDVTETIDVDFTNEAHRGIERSIPYKRDKRSTPITPAGVTDRTGQPWKTETFKENGNFFIQATTDDDSLLTGKSTFVFKYHVENTINFFEEYDELYWNVNGHDWVVPAKTVLAVFHLPEDIPANQLTLSCYTGYYGENKSDCSINRTGKIVSIVTTKPSGPYENLTVSAGLPKNIITEPSALEKILQKIKENPGIILALATLIIMLMLWHKKGRDEKVIRDTIIPHYTPPQGLLPSETGIIIDEKFEPRDVTATIIHYAIKGYILIEETAKNEFKLKLIKPYQTEKEFEQKILEAIFPQNKTGEVRTIADLKNKFSWTFKEIQKSIMQQLIKDGYFPHDPMKVRGTYMSGGLVLLVLSLNFLGIYDLNTAGFAAIGVIVIIFSWFMARKTKKGTETYYVLKGLYEYIDTAEKDRIKFQEDNNIIFEKLLPYAIVFGLAKKWAAVFEGILKTAPVWFYSPIGEHFNMTAFGDKMNSFTNVTNNTLSPGSKKSGWGGGSGFGGGGFSGGGFGGGGGRGL